jgi:hypothetical protein
MGFLPHPTYMHSRHHAVSSRGIRFYFKGGLTTTGCLTLACIPDTSDFPSDRFLIAIILSLLPGLDAKMGSNSSEYDFIVVGGESMLLEIQVGI